MEPRQKGNFFIGKHLWVADMECNQYRIAPVIRKELVDERK
jgi:hypothetical protein